MMELDLNKSMNPIFVVGPPRCGTTLMAKLLGQHSRLFMPGEMHFFDDIHSRSKYLDALEEDNAFEKIYQRLLSIYARYSEPDDQIRVERIFSNPKVKKHMKSACKTYKELLSFFMEAQAQEEGKPRWGNNVPRDIFNIDRIISFYPRAKVVICVRDIRDFLLSYQFKWRSTVPEDVERIKKMYHPIMTSFLWKSSLRQLPKTYSLVHKNNRILVRYEDLVQRPEETLKKVCQIIGEEFEPEMLNIGYNNSSFGTDAKGIFTASVGRWKRGLRPEEVEIAQIIGGQDMVKVGYQKEKVRFSPLKLLSILLSTPCAFIRALKASQALRGPLFAYLKRRLVIFSF